MSVRQGGIALTSIGGVTMPAYNHGTMTLSAGDTTETWAFFRDSAQVAQWVIVYTDSSRSVISTFTFTDLSP